MVDAIGNTVSRRRSGYTTLVAAMAFLALSTVGHADDGTGGQLIRIESSELRFARPYTPGKIPVVLVHGLLGSPDNWSVMIDTLSRDPLVKARFQFLTLRYNSLQSIPESGIQLVRSLDEARHRFDADGRDPAFERIVIVGHSLGGLVAKATSQDFRRSHPESSRAASGGGRPTPGARVTRYVFVATPHRGSPINHGALQSSGSWLAGRLSSGSPGGEPRLSSVDQLTWDHPLLAELERTRLAEGTPFHSIIATLSDPLTDGGTDGVVPVASARLIGARSEVVLRTHHYCVNRPEFVEAVRRILIEHAVLPAELHVLSRADRPPASHGPAHTPSRSGEATN